MARAKGTVTRSSGGSVSHPIDRAASRPSVAEIAMQVEAMAARCSLAALDATLQLARSGGRESAAGTSLLAGEVAGQVGALHAEIARFLVASRGS